LKHGKLHHVLVTGCSRRSDLQYQSPAFGDSRDCSASDASDGATRKGSHSVQVRQARTGALMNRTQYSNRDSAIPRRAVPGCRAQVNVVAMVEARRAGGALVTRSIHRKAEFLKLCLPDETEGKSACTALETSSFEFGDDTPSNMRSSTTAPGLEVRRCRSHPHTILARNPNGAEPLSLHLCIFVAERSKSGMSFSRARGNTDCLHVQCSS
jgi:hypothetical protein